MASLNQISHPSLKDKLKNGSTKFYFRKISGELRIAIGTLDLSRIPSQQKPKSGKGPNKCTTYYDLEKGLWRSISESQEIWVD